MSEPIASTSDALNVLGDTALRLAAANLARVILTERDDVSVVTEYTGDTILISIPGANRADIPGIAKAIGDLFTAVATLAQRDPDLIGEAQPK